MSGLIGRSAPSGAGGQAADEADRAWTWVCLGLALLLAGGALWVLVGAGGRSPLPSTPLETSFERYPRSDDPYKNLYVQPWGGPPAQGAGSR